MTVESGPDIYRPRFGSNGIGRFIIGVSPIGTIEQFDYWTTIISQYANSPILTQLIQNLNDCLDQTIDFENFYDLIWNVDTAQGYGLDVCGRIVNVNRVLSIPDPALNYFGFEEATPGSYGFNQQPFYQGGTFTNNFALSDSAYRVLIFAKALANICDGSITATNQILLNLFPNRGNCYVTDGLNMTMTYTFEFVLTPVELAIIGQSNVLPKPSGVQAAVVQTIIPPT